MFELLYSAFAVLFLSSILSGTEAALFSISMAKAELLHQEKKCSDLFLCLVKEREEYVSTLVFLNNIVNICGSMYLATTALMLFGDGSSDNRLFSIGLTLSIIIFAEILPKSIGVKKSIGVVAIMARPLQFFKFILTPAVWIVTKLTGFILRLLFGEIKDDVVTESEIEYLVQTGAKSIDSDIRHNESEIIRNAFNLHDTTALTIMTPRTCMTSLSGNETLGDCEELIKSFQHSRIIITGDSVDEILGVMFKTQLLMCLLEGKGKMKISELDIQPIREVNETTSAESLLKIFQRQQRHIAIVRDTHDGVHGVVTLEDVLEILVGEIVDETDMTEDMRELAADKKRERKLQQNIETAR